MKQLKEVPKSMLTFSGTPCEIGGLIFERMCLPAILQASNKSQPKALAQLYVGFLSSAMGAMAADFGHQAALEYSQAVVDSFSGMADELEGTRVQ